MPPPSQNRPTKANNLSPALGFTLLETLIALFSGVLLLFAVFQLFLISQKSLKAGGQNAELIQNGRIALERISRDLRQAEKIVTTTLPTPELEFQDGHYPESLSYIRYYQNGETLLREISYYAFPSDPQTRVLFDTVDENSNPPQKIIIENAEIADYITALSFSGGEVFTIELAVAHATSSILLRTAVFARNIPPL